MIEWMIPICLFWVLAAVFFGGMYDADDGSAGRQALGLLLLFGVYVGIYAVLRMALGGLGGENAFLSTVFRLVVPAAIPTMLLGRLGKLIFKLVGVTISRHVFSADAH